MALLLGKSPHSAGDISTKLWSILVQQLRFKNRPNLQRPLPRPFNRERMYQVCHPVYPPEPKYCAYDQLHAKNTDNPVKENPYAVFLAGRMRRELASHPLVGIYHFNSYTQRELLEFKGHLFDANFPMIIRETINHNVARMSLTGTRWSPLIHLLQSKSVMGFCSETDVPKLLKVQKKMPQFILIAAVIHGHILHRDDLERISKLGDVSNVRALLCSTLASSSSTISQNLTASFSNLSQSLATYAKGAGGGEGDSADDSSTSSSSSSDSDGDSDSSSSDSDTDKK